MFRNHSNTRFGLRLSSAINVWMLPLEKRQTKVQYTCSSASMGLDISVVLLK